MEDNYGINIDYLQNIIRNEEHPSKETDKYISKLVEYNFFIQNEIEISQILNEDMKKQNYHGAHRFLTAQKWDFVKICESNKQILEKINVQMENNKQFMLLKYKKEISQKHPFIHSFFYNNHINNTSIFSENPRTSHIFWDLIRVNEDLFDDLLYLNEKKILFLDFSSKNLVFNDQISIYFNNFEKCLIKDKLHFLNNVVDNGVNDEIIELQNYYSNNNLQTISKYVEIEKYINKFIKIVQSVDYYGNKHFDLYFSKQLIIHKNFHTVFQNLDNIIDDYLNQLYYLKFFSDKFKKDIILKWKIQMKTNIEQNISFLNISTEKISWKLYLFLMLERKTELTWETFSLNSLFINITYYMLKFFNIHDKSSVVHRYFKYLFTNMDINALSFCITNNQIDIKKCMNNYNKFRDTFEKLKDFNDLSGFYCLSHVTIEMQQELYDFLLKNIEYF
jgi:hypothetical protein